MAAMIIHGIQPGPMMMIAHPHFVYQVVAMTTLATITILIFGLFLVKPLLLILRIRRTVLMPIVFLLCTVGAFANASRLFDIYAMLAVGIGAFLLRRRGYHMAPFVLGMVLGPLLDKSLRRGLVLSDGSVDVPPGCPLITTLLSIAISPDHASAERSVVPSIAHAPPAEPRWFWNTCIVRSASRSRSTSTRSPSVMTAVSPGPTSSVMAPSTTTS
jgi:hypothetical protein